MPPGGPHDRAKHSCAICARTKHSCAICARTKHSCAICARTKHSCAICARAIVGAPLADEQTGRVFHPECVVGRVPEDAVVRLLGLLALIAAPTVIVWAG
jgi:hypothetical protein